MTTTQLQDLVEEWRARLIPDWRVLLMDEPPPSHPDDGSYLAVSEYDGSYRELRVHFSKEWWTERDYIRQEVTVVHELLHAVTRPWRRVSERVDGQLHRDVLALFSEAVGTEEEDAVDLLARAFVEVKHGLEATVHVGTRKVGDGWQDLDGDDG